MAIVLMFIKVSFITASLYLYVVWRFLIDGMCVILLTAAVITMKGATFHSNVWMSFIKGWY
jgi:hypothetical protein